MTTDQNKLLVRRLVEEAINHSNLDVLDEVAGGEIALAARHWIGPFRDSFPDFTMQIIDLIAEGEKVAAHFRCSGTHLGEWMGHPPTGRRFHNVSIHVSAGTVVAHPGHQIAQARARVGHELVAGVA
jgi:predicted ester cyclase